MTRALCGVLTTWLVVLMLPRDSGALRASRQAPGGLAEISGVVLDDRGTPVDHAAIALGHDDVSVGTRSDRAGRFLLASVHPGVFTLRASKPGYVTTAAGQRSPFESAPPVRIAAGQRLSVTLRLPRAGAITGTVVSNGRPARVWVAATRRAWVSPYTPEFELRSVTDELGRYRIANLPPGVYAVSTIPPVPWGVIVESGAASRHVSEVPFYFGGGWDAEQATAVRVRAGEVTTAVDIAVEPVALARVEIVATGALLDVVAGMDASLEKSSWNHAVGDPNWETDRFVLEDVPPGRYTVTVSSPRRLESLPQPLQSVKSITMPLTCGSTSVVVLPSKTSVVTVALLSEAVIDGTVSIEAFGGAQPKLDSWASWATLEPVGAPCAASANLGRGDTGAFRVGAAPGTYVIRANPVSGWFVRAATIEGRDVLDALLPIGPAGLANIILHVTRRTPALIQGRAIGRDGQPLREGTVLVFATDRDLPAADVRRTRLLPIEADGRFDCDDLTAGEYGLALTDAATMDEVDAALIRRLTSSAVRVQLAQGDVKRVEVRAGG